MADVSLSFPIFFRSMDTPRSSYLDFELQLLVGLHARYSNIKTNTEANKGSTFWVAVKELNLRYHSRDICQLTRLLDYGILN